MENSNTRGSDKLLKAWKRRTLTDESVREIAESLSKSPAEVQGASVFGGTHATGVRVSLSYSGDDVPWCGNDIMFWLKWHINHGGTTVRIPKIIINGTPHPDLLRMELDFGHVGELPGIAGIPGLRDGMGGMGG